MLLIPCPICGPRDEIEFLSGGESHIARPGPAEEVTDSVWANYLFNRDNPKGLHHERWVHSGGCGRWFNIVRSTITHEIHTVYPIDGARPHVAP